MWASTGNPGRKSPLLGIIALVSNKKGALIIDGPHDSQHPARHVAAQSDQALPVSSLCLMEEGRRKGEGGTLLGKTASHMPEIV